MTKVLPHDRVAPARHPNAVLLKRESVDALQAARDHMGEWVVWQSGFPHHKASKVQAYNLRQGTRQRILTEGYLEPDADERLEFRAWKDDEHDTYNVIARMTTAEFRVQEREQGA